SVFLRSVLLLAPHSFPTRRSSDLVVTFDLDPDLRTLGVPLVIDNALYSIGQGRGEFNIAQGAHWHGADYCRCFDDLTRFGSYGCAIVMVLNLRHRGIQADIGVEVAGDAIVKRAHAVIQLPLQGDIFHHAVAIIRQRAPLLRHQRGAGVWVADVAGAPEGIDKIDGFLAEASLFDKVDGAFVVIGKKAFTHFSWAIEVIRENP